MNNENNIDSLFKLIANPIKIKKKKEIYKENEYLKLYLYNKFDINTDTLNNLIKYIENFINSIDIEEFNSKIEIELIIENIISKIIDYE